MEKIVCYFAIVFTFSVHAQNSIGMSVNVSKLDYFHGIEYGRKFNSLEVIAGFEYGIIKTLFQSRFYPKIKVGAVYHALAIKKFSLGPIIQYGFSFLRYSKVPNGTVNYHELNTGLRWSYGEKWKIGQTLLLGGLWENGYNSIYHKRKTAGTIGFVAQIDVRYAL